MLKLFPATEHFESLSVDLLGPLTETVTGSVFLLINGDRFSKLERAVPMSCVPATAVLSAFSRDWSFLHWPWGTDLEDNGPQFACLFSKGVSCLMCIRNLYTTTYHPQTYGKVERFHQTLVHWLMLDFEDHEDNCDELVSVLALAYHSRPHRTTGVTPMYLIPPRSLSIVSLKLMSKGMTPDPKQSVAEDKNAFLESLKALLPQVRGYIANTSPKRGHMTRKFAFSVCRWPVISGITCETTPGCKS